MGETDELLKLHEHIEKLEDLLVDTESYLQHLPKCARLLTKKDCDCGLVEVQTRVHAEVNGPDEDEEDEEKEGEEKHE